MIFKFLLFSIFLSHFSLAQDNQSYIPILKSIILPGWGNNDVGQNNSFYIHASFEIILAVSYLLEASELNQLEHANRQFAKTDLNLIKEFDDEFYETISRYNSYDQYIEYELRKGKQIQNLYNTSYYWKWSSEVARNYYSEQRFLAIRKERDMRYYIYAMVLNRIVSVITTYIGIKDMRTQFRINNRIQNSYQLQIQFDF